MRENIPWWLRMGAKLVLSKMPVSYSTWSRLNLFRHGRMDSAGYAVSSFDIHWNQWRQPQPPRSILEIGPGDSVASAFIARSRGVGQSWLVDAAAYANRDLASYHALIRQLPLAEGDASALLGARDFDELLACANSRYLTSGVQSFDAVPDDSIDLLFSHATLEHIPADELAQLAHHMRRVLRPGGVASHQIDLKDHLGGGLNNLRFSRRFWESGWVRNSGFYTNRARLSTFQKLFADAGLRVRSLDARRWERLPIARGKLAPDFRALPDEDLNVSGVNVVLERAH